MIHKQHIRIPSFLLSLLLFITIFSLFQYRIYAYSSDGQIQSQSFLLNTQLATSVKVSNMAKAQLHVDGHTIKNATGKSVRLIGASSATFSIYNNTWYSSNFDDWYNKDSLSTIKSWGCNTLRLSIPPDFYHNNPNCTSDFRKYVDLATSLNLYTIINWECCENPFNYESEALSFFKEMSKAYADNPYVLYEICNEPFSSSWKEIRSYSEKIITAIRENAPNSVILVSTPYKTADQPDTPAEAIASPLNFENIVYTMHNYVGQTLTYESLDYIRAFHDANLALDISEFGTTMSTGTGGHYEVPSVIYLKQLDKYSTSWQFFNMSDIHFTQPVYDSSICKPGKWNNSLSDSSLSPSGLFFKNYITSKGQKYNSSNYCMMMNFKENSMFWSPTYRDKITTIAFLNGSKKPSTYNESWDISIDQSGKVMAYLQDNKLTIISQKGPIYAPEKSDNLFSDFKSLENIAFDNIDFSYVYSMRSIFRDCLVIKQMDFSKKSFKHLDDMSCAFSGASSLASCYFNDCDMSSLTNITRAFENCQSLTNLYWGKTDTSILQATEKAFKNCPQSSLSIYTTNSQDKELLSKLSPESSVK